MEYSSLKEYLFASGILDGDDTEVIAEAKKAYRRNYLRMKKQQYRKERKTVQLTFPRAYAANLEEQAQRHGMHLPAFIKQCLKAYLEKTFLLPNPKEVQQVELLLLRIGNNINQIAYRVNVHQLEGIPALESVRELLQHLDHKITEALRTPKDLESFITDNIVENPQLLIQLEKIINTFLDDDQNAPS